MPGIAGIINLKHALACQDLVSSMLESMKHEPAYSGGTYSVPELGLTVGWLAHEGALAEKQPLFNARGDIALMISGECFADPQIRSALGGSASKASDIAADWLVALYEQEGERFFEKLNGLFSGLLIDKRQKKAFLFNDRYGLERIYWCEFKDVFYFATEAKALLRILPELRDFDEEGLAQFLAFGCTFEWRSLFKGINLLPGASLWSFEHGICRKRTYFSPETWESQRTLSADDFQSRFDETFTRVLPRYFEGNSRTGISLTAGLDSRMIMACMPDSDPRPVCYTFGGASDRMLDATLAARVARSCGLEHHLLRVDGDFFANFATHADRTVFVTDGCFGVTGAHEIYLNVKARGLAPVRLTGNFGSEVLRGTSTFEPLGLASRLFSPGLARLVGACQEQFPGVGEHPVTFSAFRETPWNLFGSVAAGRSQVRFRTPYLDNELVALAYQVPESLRRSPLSALRLIRAANPKLARIPTDKGCCLEASKFQTAWRRLYCEATFKLDYYNNEGLPHWLSPFDPVFKRVASRFNIVGLHKYLHYRSWFRGELVEYLKSVANEPSVRQSRFWNPGFVEHIVREHTSGRMNYVQEINAILTVEAIERLLFRELPRTTSVNGRQVSDPLPHKTNVCQ